MESRRLFAYGTLLHATGYPDVDAAMAAGTRDLGPASIPGYLYSLGAYPAAVSPKAQNLPLPETGSEPQARIHGRLLEVNDPAALFAVLDAYEDFDARHPAAAEFAPYEVEAEPESPPIAGFPDSAVALPASPAGIPCRVYLYRRPVNGLPRIEDGDWLRWRRAEPEGPSRLVPVRRAEGLVSRSLRHYGIVQVTLEEAVGAVLAEDIRADRDMPPYHRVAMDGIAVSGEAWTEGRRSFRVQGSQYAGEPAKSLADKAGCFLAMTGAVLPEGCDLVIRIEDVAWEGGEGRDGREDRTGCLAVVRAGVDAKAGKNIHRRAADKRAGDRVLNAGCRLRPPELGIAASVGKKNLRVFRRPRVAILGTGDELVGPDAEIQPHQVRQSNGPALHAGLKGHAAEIKTWHSRDDRENLMEAVAEALAYADVILVTGGVSMGEKDLVPGVLRDSGVREIFHKVKQKPGKPLWFGVTDSTAPGGAGKQVFGLPGNPVSVLACFRNFVLPVIRRGSGFPPDEIQTVLLAEACKRNPKDFTLFVACSLRVNGQGERWAYPIRSQGSGDFASLAESEGLLVLEPEDLKEKEAEYFPIGFAGKWLKW